MLELAIPRPRLVEVERTDARGRPERAWELVRHGDLGRSPLIRALFTVRTLPGRLRGEREPLGLRVDEFRSSPERPGFALLGERPPDELVVGAIGKIWRPRIAFVHTETAADFERFSEPGYVKVAWAIRLLPWGEAMTRIEFEVRVTATDDASWRKFERYFRVVGPFSRLIRRLFLSSIKRKLEREAPRRRAERARAA